MDSQIPDVNDIDPTRIEEQLRNGKSIKHISLLIANGIFVHHLFDIDEIFRNLVGNLIISSNERISLDTKRENHGQDAFIDELINLMYTKTDSDIQKFYRFISKHPRNHHICNLLTDLEDKITQVRDSNAGTSGDPTQQGAVATDCTFEIKLIPNNTQQGISLNLVPIMSENSAEINYYVLKGNGSILSVINGSVILTIQIRDKWQFKILRQDLETNLTGKRLVVWLEDRGYDVPSGFAVKTTIDDEEIRKVHEHFKQGMAAASKYTPKPATDFSLWGNKEIISSLSMESPINRESTQLPAGKELSILILGKVGSGKSKLASNILDAKGLFPSSGDDLAVTTESQIGHRVVRGRKLTVVDTPGTMDPRNQEAALRQIAGAIAYSPTGYDAFLIVVRYPARITKSEKEAVDKFQDMFGSSVGDYAAMVFTGADTYRLEKEDVDQEPHFEDFIESKKLSTDEYSLGPILRKYTGGWSLINNFEKDPVKKLRQMNELIGVVDEICRKTGKKYTNEIFEAVNRVQEEEKEKGTPSDKIYEKLSDVAYDLVGKYNCFPGNAIVTLSSGLQIPISQVRVGDKVLSMDTSGKVISSNVYIHGHVNSDKVMFAVTITTASCKLTASESHYIPVSDSRNRHEPVTTKLMKHISIGDIVLICDYKSQKIRKEKVLNVERTLAKGLNNPITLNGFIIVDGVVATCYEEHIKPTYAHLMLSLLRAIYYIRPEILVALNAVRYQGIPIWAYGGIKAVEYFRRK